MSQFRNKRSRAEVVITAHPTTHNFLKLVVFTFFQLMNNTKSKRVSQEPVNQVSKDIFDSKVSQDLDLDRQPYILRNK